MPPRLRFAAQSTGFTADLLREKIVLLEARAAQRLRNVGGLWRRSTRKRPGSMTAFIRQEGLLDPAEINAIIADAPTDLIEFQRVDAQVRPDERPSMASWLDRFNLAGKYPAAASGVCNDESLQNGSNDAVRRSRPTVDFSSTRPGREDGEVSDAA